MGHGANILSLLNPGGAKLMTQLIPFLAATASGEGAGGFLNGFTINAPPLMDAEMNPISVNDADTTTLIENVTITTVGNVTNDSSQYMIDSLNRIGDDPILLTQMEANIKARAPYLDPAAASAGYRNHDPIQRAALPKVSGSPLPEKGLEPAAAAIVKGSRRKPTDRLYCSREVWEYNHIIKPTKANPLVRPLDIVAEAGDHIEHPTNPITYGQFVDSKDFRKAVELWRRLWTITRGKNVKSVTALLGTTPDGLLATLIADPAIKAQFVSLCTGVPFLQLD
jgi:hypothetical protein